MLLTELFQEKVPEIFDFVKEKYGFRFEKINDHLISAKKGDISLEFRFDRGTMFGVEIGLRGELGEEATTEAKYRKIGTTAIAKCLDKKYNPWIKSVRTDIDLMHQMEEGATELLQYCGNILEGDVAEWEKIVNCLSSK